MKIHLIIFCLLFAATTAAAQKADRSQYPQPGAPQPLQLPEVQHFIMANGLPVYLVEQHGLPLLQFILVSKAGSICDPPGQLGLAEMTADMMDEGAGERNALELSEEIDFLGVSLNTYANREELGLRLFTPASKLDKALPLFADVLLRPRFAAEELERKRTEALVALAQAHDEPQAIASEAFSQLLYGKDHPYGRSGSGTEATLKKLTAQNLRDFHRTYITPANSFLIVVGDIETEVLKKKLSGTLSGWQGGQIQSRDVPPPPQREQFAIYLIDKPGAAQSVLRFGQPGLSRQTPDEYPITVMNTILGASFTSRLNQNIREEHGYAYGARSFFWQPRHQGYFMAYADVQSDVTGPAIREFLRELRGIREVSEEEVDKARNYLALGFPGEFQDVESIAANLADVVFYDLPQDYLNRRVDRLLAVTEEQVEAAARQYVDPEKMILVVVGDRELIGKEVEALGPVKYLSIEEVMGKVPEIEEKE
ncbi:MAG: insulinase family protein [Lewinellaceae bacterium]|nr:insulinase family protein [Lewinellaceae bacterium]